MKPIPVWTNDLGNIRIYRFEARTRTILYRQDDDSNLETYSISFPELCLAIKRESRPGFEDRDELIVGVPLKLPIAGNDSAIIYPLDFCNNDEDGFTCMGRKIGPDLDDQQILDLFWLSEFVGTVSCTLPVSDNPAEEFRLFSQMSQSGNPPKNPNRIKFKFDKKHNSYSFYRETLAKFFESDCSRAFVGVDGFSKLYLRKGYSSFLRGTAFIVDLNDCQIMDGVGEINAFRSLHKSFSAKKKDLYVINESCRRWMISGLISPDDLALGDLFVTSVGPGAYQLRKLISVK